MATVAPRALVGVRIEDGTSIGRSSSTKEGAPEAARSIKGLGERRRALRSKSFDPYGPGGVAPVLESCSMAKVHLTRATRADVLEYFRNTWALTDTLFSALRDDSVFYMVPDKLRRPLIFYFGHPAALYINKMHQAGLVGEWARARGAAGARREAAGGRRGRGKGARGFPAGAAGTGGSAARGHAGGGRRRPRRLQGAEGGARLSRAAAGAPGGQPRRCRRAEPHSSLPAALNSAARRPPAPPRTPAATPPRHPRPAHADHVNPYFQKLFETGVD
jgi:hypothetical protein